VRIEDLRPPKGSNREKKRVGRGFGSGHGKTSTRGHKGQKARTGGGVKPGFEGGQMPMQRRLPKRGFNCPTSKQYSVLNLRDIERLGLKSVTPEALLENGYVKSLGDGLKVLGEGELKSAVSVRAHAFSASAARKIKEAGGTAEVI
jgi:large subunit ribosomal protein L15